MNCYDCNSQTANCEQCSFDANEVYPVSCTRCIDGYTEVRIGGTNTYQCVKCDSLYDYCAECDNNSCNECMDGRRQFVLGFISLCY